MCLIKSLSKYTCSVVFFLLNEIANQQVLKHKHSWDFTIYSYFIHLPWILRDMESVSMIYIDVHKSVQSICHNISNMFVLIHNVNKRYCIIQ